MGKNSTPAAPAAPAAPAPPWVATLAAAIANAPVSADAVAHADIIADAALAVSAGQTTVKSSWNLAGFLWTRDAHEFLFDVLPEKYRRKEKGRAASAATTSRNLPGDAAPEVEALVNLALRWERFACREGMTPGNPEAFRPVIKRESRAAWKARTIYRAADKEYRAAKTAAQTTEIEAMKPRAGKKKKEAAEAAIKARNAAGEKANAAEAAYVEARKTVNKLKKELEDLRLKLAKKAETSKETPQTTTPQTTTPQTTTPQTTTPQTTTPQTTTPQTTTPQTTTPKAIIPVESIKAWIAGIDKGGKLDPALTLAKLRDALARYLPKKEEKQNDLATALDEFFDK